MAAANRQDSHSAGDLVSNVQDRVVETSRFLEAMLAAMDGIGSASEGVSNIINVIDGIAFQTNILALNAAVEAARAGETGLGFAVVADEVRSLAQRSAQAAKDTSALVEDSISKAREGQLRVQDLSNAIHAISNSSGTVKTLVQQVGGGTEQQALGIEQVSKALNQISEVTQHAAATAEESAGAAQELRAQTVMLNDLVDSLTALVCGA